MKTCKECGLEKPLEEFPISSGQYRRSLCKLCYNEAQKAYREQNHIKESVQKSWRDASKRYQSNPVVQHRRRLAKYSLSVEEYDELFDSQNGLCAICSRDITLVIDHCHYSNKVRGLLCNGCNLGIGYFEDDLDRLRRAIVYLESASAGPATI